MRQALPKGFTLIEILIVLVIMSITVGFAVLAFGDFGKARQVTAVAAHLKTALGMLREQAILGSEDFVLVLDNAGYHAQSSAKNTALSPALAKILTGTFPTGTVMSCVPAAKPLMIAIHATGTMTAFRCVFGTKARPQMAVMLGKENGKVTLDQAK